LSIARAIPCLGVILSVTGFAYSKSCPPDMVVAAPGVCIDKYEWPNMKGEHPEIAQSAVVEVVGEIHDADTICALNGRRTCEYSEWVAACLGPNGSRYPYGDKFVPGACNNDKLWRDVDFERVYHREDKELSRLNQSSASGAYDNCKSASGAYDMVGNAEEWVRCDQGKFGWCLVGGFWANAQSCYYAVGVHAPNWHYYETGFRCCKDME
jgi:hypothetical protein